MQPSDVLEVSLRKGFSREQVAAALRNLDEEQVTRLAWLCKWSAGRHEHQVPPKGEWSVWMIMAGRGAGKTRCGAEWTGMGAATAEKDSGFRHLVAAPVSNDLRKVCYGGDSGLIACIPPSLIKGYNITDSIITLHNGSIIGGIAAENPRNFRGPNWHRAWIDELAAWGDNGRDPQYAWDMMVFSVRLGSDTRKLVTTTPRPLSLIKKLVKDEDTIVTTASTYSNLPNLSPDFAREILKYEGTKIGRQEIHAEIINAEEDGIISRSDLKLWPTGRALPQFEMIVMSLDTAYSEESYDKRHQKTDPSACSVWGGFRYKGKPGIMLLDCWAEKLGFPDLVDKVKAEMKQRYGETDKKPMIAPQRGPKATLNVGKAIDLVIIEEKASGKSLRQQLAKESVFTYGYNPGNASKLTRLHIVSPLTASGVIWIPESSNNAGQFMTWAQPLVEQLCTYSGEGTVMHDDLMDTTTQAWRVLDDQWLYELRKKLDKKPQHMAEPTPPRTPTINPYGA